MKNIVEIANNVEKYMRDNELFCDVYPYMNDMPIVIVSIRWGDWKHEHLRADWIMEEQFEGTLMKTEVTEDNGSDTYSADRYYYISNFYN